MISELCIFTLATHAPTVLLRHEGHIEAPNWHPDGYLIVNGDGLLYRVPLNAPELIALPTGFATGCNNDHGFSPDSQTLAISDKTETGQSCIYLLPIGGGTPKRVTAKVPSWWHGWSPDGLRLVYVGVRRAAGPVALYTCATDGSDELCVTEEFDHVDGPDYSSDGAWIWFNGERDGAVDLWRIHPDGTGLERMTDDAAVNWFPHPSPDGSNVVYLAFPAGTKGHPAGRDVSLRLLPANGGPSRQLCNLWGGQGTINVPSWSPDGKCFAFMRYVA